MVPELEGGQLAKADQLREKDLKHHFKGEGEADAPALKISLPDNLKPWEVSDKLPDYQLKVALSYLHGLAMQAEGRNTARAPNSKDR